MTKRSESTALDSWSAVIERVGEESRQKQDQRVKALRVALRTATRDLHNRTNRELLGLLTNVQGSADPRENELQGKFRKAVSREILARMR